ncbi:hypothetical protein [Halomicrococcus gelatinilyticus]|uniref:hypothetical protein n=1 Tax=Halomicrococcus gelatinilyticus TaxID=1702103 RepID=UPI002E0FE962
MPEFYVLLAAVVGSRAVDDRAEFRRRLDRACERASRHDEVHTPFDVLKRVEGIGGVLSAGTSIWSVVVGLAVTAVVAPV